MIKILAWASLEAESKVRILLQEVCLGGDPRKQECRSVDRAEEEKSIKGCSVQFAAAAKGLQLPQGLRGIRMPPGRLLSPTGESCLYSPEFRG